MRGVRGPSGPRWAGVHSRNLAVLERLEIRSCLAVDRGALRRAPCSLPLPSTPLLRGPFARVEF